MLQVLWVRKSICLVYVALFPLFSAFLLTGEGPVLVTWLMSVPCFLVSTIAAFAAKYKSRISPIQFETWLPLAEILAIDPGGSYAARFYRLIHLAQKWVMSEIKYKNITPWVQCLLCLFVTFSYPVTGVVLAVLTFNHSTKGKIFL